MYLTGLSSVRADVLVRDGSLSARKASVHSSRHLNNACTLHQENWKHYSAYKAPPGSFREQLAKQVGGFSRRESLLRCPSSVSKRHLVSQSAKIYNHEKADLLSKMRACCAKPSVLGPHLSRYPPSREQLNPKHILEDRRLPQVRQKI